MHVPELAYYQEQGLSFFSLPFGKKEADIPWKCYQDRKPTDAEITTWFDNGAKHNIAVVCGRVSNGLVVLDCDSIERFYELSLVICEKLGIADILDFTRCSETGKGIHIWLFVEDPPPSQKFPRLDVKSDGGYIVAPPSLHPSGKEYKFLNPSIPIKRIHNLLDIGIDITTQKPAEEPRNEPGWVSQLLKGVGEGARNDSAIKLAGYFRNLIPIDITEHILLDWNARNIPPMPLQELQQVIISAYVYPPHPPNGVRTNNIIEEAYDPHPPPTPSLPQNLSVLGQKVNTITPNERYKSVTESVTGVGGVTESITKIVTKSRAEQIENWVKETTGWFSYEEIDKEFGIKSEIEKINRRVIVKRLRDAGIIEAHPKNNKLLRFVNVVVRLIDFKAALKRTPVAVKYPFGIEAYFNTYPGNIVALAGAADAGKTAWLLNFIRLNQFDYSIFYQSSEMGKEELASRLTNFEGIALDEWNFQAEERSSNFADVIRPDCINIIDYMELTGDFYNVAEYLRQIHDKLASGICIVALQKKRGAELGRGGDFGLEKPRLYLSMDAGILRIQKAKNWVDPAINPNRLMLNFKIVAGCRFIAINDWHKDESTLD